MSSPGRRALGRGLAALIPDAEMAVTEVPVERLEPNAYQPRTALRAEALQELSESIRLHGVLQPLLVTRVAPASEIGGPRYRIIAGERRWRAAQAAGLATVPVVVREAAPREALELALVENLQRQDLHPLEEAAAYHQLQKEFALTQEEVARRVGRDRTTVANALRLLRLDEGTRTAFLQGAITEGHARALLGVEEETRQRLLLQVVEQRLSVRQTEELTRRAGAPVRRRAALPDVGLQAVEEQLRLSLGTRVQLQRSRHGGRLILHFYSEEEMEELLRRLLGAGFAR